ncbi:hypothetical protein [uncultured Legionella sp.]|uniref:hypothetical protein n=1 Tax=uncultured Legionella sp. TaxID=210934 RepID=UPI0026229A2C|nr:hypothetical protein [uncultured Legionella sp.]
MIEGRRDATKKAYDDAMNRGGVDPSERLYELQAQTIKNLIDAGAVVTSDVLKKAAKDNHDFGTDRIETALSDKSMESTLQTIQKTFERQSEIRKNSRVLAQAFRIETSLFSTIPLELATRIASLMGNDVNSIEENETDLEFAASHFTKPN